MVKKITPNVLGYLLYYKNKKGRVIYCYPPDDLDDYAFTGVLYPSIDSVHKSLQEDYFDTNTTYYIIPIVEYTPILDEFTVVCYKNKVYFGAEGKRELAAVKRKKALADKKKTQKG